MTKKAYFIGIGGISMSSLAVFLKFQGYQITGSDLAESDNLKMLKPFDIPYFIGHSIKNIKNFNPNLVVINCAIHEDNKELIWARQHNKKIISRAELLGKISKNFKNVIAISGTHGKTTTTALLTEIFIQAGFKPTVHVGGILKCSNSNFLIGDKKYFITEACEYKNSFLSLSPNLGAILNIEPDHLDFFKNIEQINDSFMKFLENSTTKLSKIDDFKYLIKNEKMAKFYSAENIKKNEIGYCFDFIENGQNLIAHIQTNFCGEHNVKNALVASIIAHFYKIRTHIIKKSIRYYHGVKRRFENITTINNCLIIHDYAHHPTEIAKVINQAKHYGKVLTIFQPHTFSRTQNLLQSFLTCFNETDGLILTKTYSARETESQGMSAKELFVKISQNKYSQNNQNNIYNNLVQNTQNILIKNNVQKVQNITLNKYVQINHIFKPFMYIKNLDKKVILDNTNKFDCILILGAGDINLLAESLK